MNKNTEIGKIGLAVTQFIRLSLDFTQLFLSVQFNEQDPSNMVSSLWIWNSTSTNFLSFLNNFNDLVPLNLMSTFGITYTWASKYSFEQVTLFLQGVVQAFGGLGALIIYLFGESSIPQSKFWIDTGFTGLYIVQRLVKAALFILKVNKEISPKWERILYGFSILCNLGQLLSTIYS